MVLAVTILGVILQYSLLKTLLKDDDTNGGPFVDNPMRMRIGMIILIYILIVTNNNNDTTTTKMIVDQQ